VVVVDLTAKDPAAGWRTIRDEVEAFSPELASAPALVALTKADLVDAQEIPALCGGIPRPMVVTSAVSGEGIVELRASLFDPTVSS
jgi:GTP-binding protein